MTDMKRCRICTRSKYPNQMATKTTCKECAGKTHGELQAEKRNRARKTAWNEGMGWVK